MILLEVVYRLFFLIEMGSQKVTLAELLVSLALIMLVLLLVQMVFIRCKLLLHEHLLCQLLRIVLTRVLTGSVFNIGLHFVMLLVLMLHDVIV